MIFKVLQIRKMANEATENPGKFAGGKVGEIFVGMLFVPSVVVLLILITFFVFGYTSFLGGPYIFFQFIFILFLLIVISIVYFLRKIYLIIKSVTKNVVNTTIKMKSQIIE